VKPPVLSLIASDENGVANPRPALTNHRSITMSPSRVAALLSAFILLAACSDGDDELPSTEQAGDPQAQPSPPAERPAEAVPEAVSAHLAVLMTEGPDFEIKRLRSIANLRATPAASLAALSQTYRDLPASESLERWKVVLTMGDVGSTHAVAPLLEIALSPVGAPLAGEAYEEEALIRLRAVAALQELMTTGQPGAEEALRTCIREGDAYVRSAAAHAYLEGTRRTDERVAEVRALLPRGQERLADIRAATAEDMKVEAPQRRSRPHKHDRAARPLPPESH
jgi:hypothetical protein